ncbi:hypothetical protein EDB85DRAFT_2296793 [Lactarius pseudohatsudake]|nr:hypothetical protein EDB85DRAFT_2296793 [Lactarius pseudohatsudake]
MPTVYASAHGIVSEAYSPLIPITHQSGGPVDKPLDEIAQRLGATTDQVLLAWVRAKGAVAVTYVPRATFPDVSVDVVSFLRASSKKFRLEGYLAAGDLKISAADIEAIDSAGAKGAR